MESIIFSSIIVLGKELIFVITNAENAAKHIQVPAQTHLPNNVCIII